MAASRDFESAPREGNKRTLALRRCQHAARSVSLETETRMEVRRTDGQFPASSCGNTAWSDSFRAELPRLLFRREPIGSVSRPRECARARRPPEFPVFRWNSRRQHAIEDPDGARARQGYAKESQLARSRFPARGCCP